MGKTAGLFKAYDLQRKNQHTISSPPTKIHQHRVDKREWAAAAGTGRKQVQKRRAAKKFTRHISTAAEILKEDSSETACLHCGLLGDEPECGVKCYRDFCKENFPSDFIDIKGPGTLGYGAYTKPGVYIKRGQWLGEYLGDINPLGYQSESKYIFQIPGKCVLDAEKAGNWTRFINSNCQPNVQAIPDFIGKRNVILFRAKRDIGPEEELSFNYGKHYFKNAGFSCRCSACQPVEKKRKGRK